VPTLVVLNLQSVNFAQKAAAGGTAADGLPSPRLRRALRYADGAVGRIAALLAARGSAADTLLVVFAKHGQAPRRGRATLVARSAILRPLRRAGIGVAHLWLGDRSNAARAARVLAPLGRVVPGVPGPSSAVVRRERAPDLVLVPRPGVVFVGNPAKATKRAEHGGFSPDDRDVPLIVWSSRLGAAADRSVAVPVETRQIAPTVLAALGLHARELSGVRAEGTRPLPGLPLP
jgi:arylsulfatase A-like enzyme